MLGLIGMLIGLVQMFVTMEDFFSIGFVMVVVLLITFYGVILVNVIFNFIVGKLKMCSIDEVLMKSFEL